MKKTLAVILSFVMVFSLAACSGGASNGAPEGTTPDSVVDPDKITIAAVHRNLLGASGVNFRAAYYYQAALYDVNLMFFDGNQNVQAQCDYIEDCVASGNVDAFIVWACDADGIAGSVQSLYDKGIPVITVDIEIPADSHAFVTAGNYEMGVMTGESAVEYLTKKNGGPKGTVYVITATTQSTARDRTAGFLSVIEKHPDIKVVGTYDMPTTSIDDGVALADDLIQKNPEGSVDVYYNMNITPMLGLISAAATYNRNDFVLVGGFDYNDSIVEDMYQENGVVYSFAAQDCFEIGKRAFTVALEAAQGNVPDNAKIDVPGELVTKENLDEYMKKYNEIQKIISSYQ